MKVSVDCGVDVPSFVLALTFGEDSDTGLRVRSVPAKRGRHCGDRGVPGIGFVELKLVSLFV